MNGKCLSAYVTAIANLLTERFTVDELRVLAAVFTQLGDTLVTILEADALAEKCECKK
ncbi:MAG: DUF6774 domain-containing protein [Acutalibacteraceae bacterium]